MAGKPLRPIPNLWQEHYGNRVYRGVAITALDRPEVLKGPRPAAVHALPIAWPPDPESVFDPAYGAPESPGSPHAAPDDTPNEAPTESGEPGWSEAFLAWMLALPRWAKVVITVVYFVVVLSVLGFLIWIMLWGPFTVKVGFGIIALVWVLADDLHQRRRRGL